MTYTLCHACRAGDRPPGAGTQKAKSRGDLDEGCSDTRGDDNAVDRDRCQDKVSCKTSMEDGPLVDSHAVMIIMA